MSNWAALISESPTLGERDVETLICRIAEQLHRDAEARGSGGFVSDLCEHAPRVHGKIDKLNRLAHRIAEMMWPPGNDSEPLRVWAIIRYRQLIAKLSAHRREVESQKEITRRLGTEATVAHLSREVYNDAKSRPISEAIKFPMPMPIKPAPTSEFEPFLNFLKKNNSVLELPSAFLRGIVYPDGRMDLCKQGVGSEGPVEFERGILYPDGRMDLCKQGVGSEGPVEFERGICYSDGRMDLCKQGVGSTTIDRVLEALTNNTHVVHFLLGNDIVGPQGGRAIARHISSPHSRIITWYLAGNMLDAEAIGEIAKALSTDNRVQALWLKRNPVLLKGVEHLAAMLSVNSSLRILDIDNTGLLDAGTEALMKGLEGNRTLETLYLSANGITAQGAKAIGEYFEGCHRKGERGLVNLMMCVNRIGDEGATALAKGLAQNKHLKRLALASERIESQGAKDLCMALRGHPALLSFDLGMYLSTADMGELPNRIEDAGAEAVATLIRENEALKSVSVAHNALTSTGVKIVCEAALTSNSLLDVKLVEKGLPTDSELKNELQQHLEKNIQNIYGSGMTQKEFVDQHLRFVRNIPEVANIDSLYRTRDFKKPDKERRLLQKWWDGVENVHIEPSVYFSQ